MAKYLIKTYGCQMNIHESEKLAGVLEKAGFSVAENEKDADIIVFNTCCIRESAEQKIYAHIGALKSLAKQNPNLIVAVCGCMAQEKGTSDIIQKKFPFVKIVFGTHNLALFEDYLNKYLLTKKRVFEVWESEGDIVEGCPKYRTSGYNAWVNISYGCNNFCTYCIVPYVRGRERSRDMNDIINEVKELVNNGYKYITLLGQNVNSYGNDIDDKNVTFANLLDKLSDLDGDFKIKFMTSHPKDLNDEVIDVIARKEKICKVIHLPCQSGSTKILKAMNRRYTRESYMALIDKIKSRINNVVLTSDFIVGFPGETEQDFLDTCSLVEYCRYNSIFAFMYSKRKGTIAEKMDNQIDIATKRERVNKLLAIQHAITKEINIQLLDTIHNVIVETKLGENQYLTKTDCGKTIVVECSKDLLINAFVNIKVTKVTNNKIQGQLIGD